MNYETLNAAWIKGDQPTFSLLTSTISLRELLTLGDFAASRNNWQLAMVLYSICVSKTTTLQAHATHKVSEAIRNRQP